MKDDFRRICQTYLRYNMACEIMNSKDCKFLWSLILSLNIFKYRYSEKFNWWLYKFSINVSVALVEILLLAPSHLYNYWILLWCQAQTWHYSNSWWYFSLNAEQKYYFFDFSTNLVLFIGGFFNQSSFAINCCAIWKKKYRNEQRFSLCPSIFLLW